MIRTLLLCALLTACAGPTTREVCGTLPDGSEFCTIVTTTRSPQ